MNNKIIILKDKNTEIPLRVFVAIECTWLSSWKASLWFPKQSYWKTQ